VFIAAEYYMPLYLQSVLAASALKSGILLLPLIVAAATSGVVAGFVIHRTGRFREVIWAGTVFTCLGFGLFILFDVRTSTVTLVGIQILCGFGYGALFEAPLIAIQSQVEQQDVATATSTLTFIRNMALAISTIVGGVIFQNSMANRVSVLGAAGLPQEVLQQLDGANAMANVMLPSTLDNANWKLAAKQAFAWSMRNMWIAYTGVAFLAIIASFFVEAAHLGTEHTETVTGLKKREQDTPMNALYT
jgi:MFS family permease